MKNIAVGIGVGSGVGVVGLGVGSGIVNGLVRFCNEGSLGRAAAPGNPRRAAADPGEPPKTQQWGKRRTGAAWPE